MIGESVPGLMDLHHPSLKYLPVLRVPEHAVDVDEDGGALGQAVAAQLGVLGHGAGQAGVPDASKAVHLAGEEENKRNARSGSIFKHFQGLRYPQILTKYFSKVYFFPFSLQKLLQFELEKYSTTNYIFNVWVPIHILLKEIDVQVHSCRSDCLF